jgi:hypothetical protein
MERAEVIPAALVMVLVVLVAASRSATAPARETGQWDTSAAESQGVTMEIAVRTENVAGEPIPLRITITNRSSKPAVFVRRERWWVFQGDFDVRIADTGGEAVAPTRFGRAALVPSVSGKARVHRVSPGDSWSTVLNLARVYDLSVSGRYRVSVTRVICEPSTQPNPPSLKIEVKDLEFLVAEPPTPESEIPKPITPEEAARRNPEGARIVNQIKEGMSQQEVTKLLGKPTTQNSGVLEDGNKTMYANYTVNDPGRHWGVDLTVFYVQEEGQWKVASVRSPFTPR